jgi:hypothetical protein
MEVILESNSLQEIYELISIANEETIRIIVDTLYQKLINGDNVKNIIDKIRESDGQESRKFQCNQTFIITDLFNRCFADNNFNLIETHDMVIICLYYYGYFRAYKNKLFDLFFDNAQKINPLDFWYVIEIEKPEQYIDRFLDVYQFDQSTLEKYLFISTPSVPVLEKLFQRGYLPSYDLICRTFFNKEIMELYMKYQIDIKKIINDKKLPPIETLKYINHFGLLIEDVLHLTKN